LEGRLTTRLILNADDFGRSRSINEAIIRAHREGVLTSASLMVNGEAAQEAVELARQNPSLAVGLHLTVAVGRAALAPMQIPALVRGDGRFSDHPVWCGLNYFFNPMARTQLTREIDTQFARFHATGLPLDHVNGHLNFHLHPTIVSILLSLRERWPGSGFRLTHDDFALSESLRANRWWYRFVHAMVFGALSNRAAPAIRHLTHRTTKRVFGLLQNDAVDETYLLKLLPKLPEGPIEIYSHPNMDTHRLELDALLSSRVADLIKKLGIERCRYQDL
jgi:hopanoid biosynthesis associated protein HpnK